MSIGLQLSLLLIFKLVMLNVTTHTHTHTVRFRSENNAGARQKWCLQRDRCFPSVIGSLSLPWPPESELLCLWDMTPSPWCSNNRSSCTTSQLEGMEEFPSHGSGLCVQHHQILQDKPGGQPMHLPEKSQWRWIVNRCMERAYRASGRPGRLDVQQPALSSFERSRGLVSAAW